MNACLLSRAILYLRKYTIRMESDPLSNSPLLNYLKVTAEISDYVVSGNQEKIGNLSEKRDESASEHENTAYQESANSQILSYFICFVCNNEFDDMAKLHVHMSMKHKGIKVCGISCKNS